MGPMHCTRILYVVKIQHILMERSVTVSFSIFCLSLVLLDHCLAESITDVASVFPYSQFKIVAHSQIMRSIDILPPAFMRQVIRFR